MNLTTKERDVTQHCFDPFPEPQTIPAGWDTSAILPAPLPAASAQQAEDTTESDSVAE